VALTSRMDEDRIHPDDELQGLLALALKGAQGDGVSRTLLSALRESMDKALGQHARKERDLALSREWNPRPEQTWTNGQRTKDNKRLTAWMVFQAHYENIDFDERPFAHQVRQHPETHELYRALCVLVSRNKARGQNPSSISQLFPATREARGGLLAPVEPAEPVRRGKKR
jgi:hypothetical protein